ncbi:MAG: prepilin-type N-terminal cleavage/methylation domain-containing protein, partial [Fuerstiella sp.]
MALTATNSGRTTSPRQGFTLVEMLISVTLVLLMMTMFTSIFQMATDSVSKQKGIAQNDQRARAVTTIMRGDLSKRTFRYVLPFSPEEAAAVTPSDFGERAGYFYISTNDPDSWQDVVLQFTANVKLTQEDTDDTRYFGAAKLLYDLQSDPEFTDSLRRTSLRNNPNQPDADDGDLSANNVSASSAAEISYFVRNGGLYRRVMLLREPLPVAGEDLDIQPSSSVSTNSYFGSIPAYAAGSNNFGGAFAVVTNPLAINYTDNTSANFFNRPSGTRAATAWATVATNDFWRHFDFSAVPILKVAPAGLLPDTADFVGVDFLDNGGGALSGLGDPRIRFGFNRVTGLSREHNDSTAGRLFIGRFTQAETSHPNFNWPMGASRVAAADEIDIPGVPVNGQSAFDALNSGPLIGNGNPMDVVGTPLTLNANGVITQFAGITGRGGVRRVEDLLMANVHGLKVEIWDDRLERFVQPSHNSLTQILDSSGGLQTTAGDYHVSRRLNAAHGPLGTALAATNPNRVFDTWHSKTFLDYNGNGTQQNFERAPPYIAYRYYPPRETDPPFATSGAYPNGPGPMP